MKTISELIKELEELKAQHGDLHIVVQDKDTGWPIPVTSVCYSDEREYGVENDEFVIHYQSYQAFMDS